LILSTCRQWALFIPLLLVWLWGGWETN